MTAAHDVAAVMPARGLQRALDRVSDGAIALAASALFGLVLVQAWQVFTRYVLGHGSSWPEPLAILLMIVFSMLSAAVCYRDNLHIAVLAIPDNLPPAGRTVLGWLAEICMILVSIFMLIWGIALVETTWPQTIAEFPALSTGITYLPIPIGGAIVLLFVIERLWTGQLFAAPEAASIAAPRE